MKKNKKTEPKFEYGKRIREIEIDKTQHVFELTFAVLIFATILLTAIISLGSLVEGWFVWLLCGLVLVYFITHSTLFIIKTWKNPKYAFHENCLLANSIWSYKVVKYNDIRKVQIKKSVFDIIQKEEMYSIEICYEDSGRRKVVLHCITEDVNKLIAEIKSKSPFCEK